MTTIKNAVRVIGLISSGWWLVGVLAGAQSGTPAGLTSYATETRNRAAVLLVGDLLTPGVAQRMQARWADEAAFFRPTGAATDAALDGWLTARTWHVAVIGVGADRTMGEWQSLVRKLKARGIVVVGCVAETLPGRENAALREFLRVEGVETTTFDGTVLEESLRPALFARSTPWAELPAGEKRDPTRLLADPGLLASPMDLPEAKGTTAMVYRAEEGGWQFNLHSFIAHHDGKFWAVWSSGRVDEDSSSQMIRYATSVDGLIWSEARVLAPDPDGEGGPWRWMASGVYADGGRLLALGSLNQGNAPPGGPWAKARLVRFVWSGAEWREDRVVAENSVVYFPPLRVAERDFFVWRDSRAFFYTAWSPAGLDRWTVTRMPGPLPDYRMSETSAYVDPDGAVHLIIRDQGYTRRLYHAISHDAGSTWTVPVKTNYPDAMSKNMAGRLSNGWYYLISNPKAAGANARDPLAITFSRDGWTFSQPLALRKNGSPLRYKGGAKGPHSFQYSHAIEHDGKLWVIYATNKEDIEVSAYPIGGFGLAP
ncbi:MAG: hypothetical protein EXS37_10695 [Opitutus sp.]|nr:hypothetical protein [Opitutus sp.]